VLLRQCSNVTTVRVTTTDHNKSKANSDAATCSSIAASADWSV